MLEFERLNTALAERDSEIASLREQLATAETRLRNALPHTKKIETMKVVVAAMAVIGYGHDPFAKKSPSTTEIVSDLEKLGVDRDADTVRAVLRAALKTIPQEHLVQHFGRSKTNSG